MPGGQKSPGRRPRKKQRPNGRKSPGRRPIKTLSVKETPPEGRKKPFQKKPGPQAQKNIVNWQQKPRPNGRKETS